MLVDDEVLVDAVFALADLALDERLLGERRKPLRHELAAPAKFIRSQRVLLSVGIDDDALERRDNLEPFAFDAREPVCGVVTDLS
jgi:hypothetical protein